MMMSMTMEIAAEAMNGREYRAEGDRAFFAMLREAGLVAVFGASDDLTEFRGAIYDETGAYDGGEHKLTQSGLLQNNCGDDDCPFFAKMEAGVPVAIRAKWDCEGYSWFIETDLPHATFDIMEDDEKYCRGVVIALADLPA